MDINELYDWLQQVDSFLEAKQRMIAAEILKEIRTRLKFLLDEMCIRDSYNTYPRGVSTEQTRYFSGKAWFLDTPEPRLDQSSTYKAIHELQMVMEYFPTSSRRQDAQQMIFDLQDKLVMKDYLACLLYTSRCV